MGENGIGNLGLEIGIGIAIRDKEWGLGLNHYWDLEIIKNKLIIRFG